MREDSDEEGLPTEVVSVESKALEEDLRDLSPGDLVGGHVITGLMARGGCATVYAAEHRVLGRRVAVKVMRRELADDPEMVARFIREARAVNLIRHPNIVDIFDIGTLPDVGPYYVMEYLEGLSVQQLVASRGRLTPREVVPILRAVGDALTAAHAHGVIHRDLKASNIFLAKGLGRELAVKLLDFGIAKLFHAGPTDVNLTTAHRRLGTPAYMPPEQVRGEAIDVRADVYALAATVFSMLTGRPPFCASNFDEVERMHLENEPPRASHYSPVGGAIDEVLLKGMAKCTTDRHPTIEELVEAFTAAVRSSPLALREEICLAVFGSARASGSGGDLSALDFADALEDGLQAQGFRIAMRAGASCLGVKTCGAVDPRELVQSILALARAVIAESIDCEPTIFVKRGIAAVDEAGASGPLLEYAVWLPATAATGVLVAEELAPLAGAPTGTEVDGGFVQVSV